MILGLRRQMSPFETNPPSDFQPFLRMPSQALRTPSQTLRNPHETLRRDKVDDLISERFRPFL